MAALWWPVILPTLLALVYVLLNYSVQATLQRDGPVILVWPGSGLALAMLLIGGMRYFWFLLLGEAGLRLLTGDALAWEIGATLANLLEAALGYYFLVGRTRRAVHFHTLGDFLRLTFWGGVMACLAGSLLGAAALSVMGLLPADVFIPYLSQRWMGHAFGVVLLTPLALAWLPETQIRLDRWRKRRVEAMLLMGLTFLMGQAVFMDWFQDMYIGKVARGYWMFLPIMWIGVRLGRRGVTLALVMIAFQAMLGALDEKGFFSDDLVETGLQNYWYYMVILASVGVAVALYVGNLESVTEDLVVKDSALRSTANSIVITDPDGRIEWANAAFTRMTGYSLDEVIGRNPGNLVKSGRHDAAYYRKMWNTIKFEKQVWRGEFVNRRKDGALYEEEMTITPICDEDGNVEHFVAVRQDVSERKALEREVREQAFHDALTGLPNRRFLMDRLTQAIAVRRRHGDSAALMLLDMDKFKHLNDTHGHAMGDAMLIEVATRMKHCVRKVDMVARLGGDEFVVLLEDLDADPGRAREQAALVAEKIRVSLAQSYALQTEGGGEPLLQESAASIGVVVFDEQSVAAGDVLRWADTAMYQAKEAGGDRVQFSEPAADLSQEHAR